MAGLLAKLRLAWRDLMAQGRRSLFFALLVAAGVASLVGVQGMARSMEGSLHATARQMIQGDILITISQELTDGQRTALQALEEQGALVTESLQHTAHVTHGQGHAMVELKVVDPAHWPFYGGYRTSPEGARPGKGESLVGPGLLTRLGLNVGDSFTVDDVTLQIIGTILEEPIPIGQVPMGPRVLIAAESWADRSNGNNPQVLIKLPDRLSPADAKAALTGPFDQGAIMTADEAWQTLAGIMEKLFTFLAMIALISLLVGGLGVAMAMRTFIRQKLEQIAVLKAIGASTATVMTIFLAEAALLGIGGSLLGAGLGLIVQLLLPKLFEGLLPVGASEWDAMVVMSGLGSGVAIALLSALVPIRAIRAIKPVALFRGETSGAIKGGRAWAEALLLGLLTLAGVAWLSALYAKSVTVGLGFFGGLLLAALLLFLLAWALLRMLRLLPQAGRPTVRHAVRSLNAPGNQSASVVVAMGLGIMLMTGVYLIQNSLLQQIKSVGAGPNTPNLFIMSHRAERRGDLVKLLESHPKVTKVLDTVLAVDAELLLVDGQAPSSASDSSTPLVEMVTGSPVTLPTGVTLLEGEWFTASDQGQPHLTVLDRFAKRYEIHVGSTVTLRLKEERITFTVTSIYTSANDGMMSMSLSNLSAAPETIDRFADNYMVTAVTRPHQEESVMIDLLAGHPEAMPVSLGAYLEAIESLLGRVANILRFLTAFAVAAAGVILSGSLSASRLRRRKEAALLKSLGASRATVAIASGIENGLIGIVAGLAGSGLAYLLVQAVGLLLQMRLDLGLVPLLLATLAGALLAMLVGVGSTLDLLQVKPLEVLRSE